MESNIRDEMEDQVPQARIYRAWHAPAVKNMELQRLGLLAGVLAGSNSARLERRLVHEKGLATAVNAGVNDSELGSTKTWRWSR